MINNPLLIKVFIVQILIHPPLSISTGHTSDQEEAYETTVEEERQEENQRSSDKARMAVLSAVPRYHTI